eukprot:scaffold1590_cov417-Prasinococcus_capsulatus_cf.AAC.9
MAEKDRPEAGGAPGDASVDTLLRLASAAYQQSLRVWEDQMDNLREQLRGAKQELAEARQQLKQQAADRAALDQEKRLVELQKQHVAADKKRVQRLNMLCENSLRELQRTLTRQQHGAPLRITPKGVAKDSSDRAFASYDMAEGTGAPENRQPPDANDDRCTGALGLPAPQKNTNLHALDECNPTVPSTLSLHMSPEMSKSLSDEERGARIESQLKGSAPVLPVEDDQAVTCEARWRSHKREKECRMHFLNSMVAAKGGVEQEKSVSVPGSGLNGARRSAGVGNLDLQLPGTVTQQKSICINDEPPHRIPLQKRAKHTSPADEGNSSSPSRNQNVSSPQGSGEGKVVRLSVLRENPSRNDSRRGVVMSKQMGPTVCWGGRLHETPPEFWDLHDDDFDLSLGKGTVSQ